MSALVISSSSSRERDSVFRVGWVTKSTLSLGNSQASLWRVIFPGWGNFCFKSEMTLISSGLEGAKPSGNIWRYVCFVFSHI